MRETGKDNDLLRRLFAAMPCGELPEGFGDRLMERINREARVRRVRGMVLSAAGYAAVLVSAFAVCAFVLHYEGYRFEMPEWSSVAWQFPVPDFGAFRSTSFLFGVNIGAVALVLATADMLVRRRMGRMR